ncbi:hypothetical protein [Dictyobacter formicarum]|uniref:LysM domain-containing protein n=1 Tax=Dictyobacter formicarum TaxID=2778368 RepID=A0ABQ3VVQ1_9CHLR|nr:hypothetical protein [Dictyobacter formicarum]GHO89709.1 hypothetical protein KSZ_77150 [Dictyobacter formicarum]
MAHRFHPRSTPKENLHIFFRSIPWKLIVIIPIMVLLAVPTFIYGAHAGSGIIPSVTNMFYTLSNVSNLPTPTPLPAFLTTLPQVGSIQYTVGEGDNCDEILAYSMHMYGASQVFSDANANTVKQLSHDVGQDCHRLQPGMILTLSPQYPIVALGGVLLKIDAATARQVLPTPLIKVHSTEDYTPDCSKGCLLTLRITSTVTVHLNVQTALPLHLGAWIWTQAMLPHKVVPGFSNYPYADPTASFNGMTLRACDFQVNDTHDDDSVPCSQLEPNTINDDGGAWLLGVTGSNSLDHWRYPIHAPAGTQIMVWLQNDNGTLRYHRGDPIYRYDVLSQLYVKL